MGFLATLWFLLAIVLTFGAVAVLIAGLISTHRHKAPKEPKAAKPPKESRRKRRRDKRGETPPLVAVPAPVEAPPYEPEPAELPRVSSAPPAGEVKVVPVRREGRNFVDVWLEDDEEESAQ